MRARSALSVMVLAAWVPAALAQSSSFAYERSVLLPERTVATPAWITLDPHALSLSRGELAILSAGQAVALRRVTDTQNVAQEATITTTATAAATTRANQLAFVSDGNTDTTWQPVTAASYTFTIRLGTPRAVDELQVRLAEGWLQSVRVRGGTDAGTLTTLYDGRYRTATLPLTGEVVSLLEITLVPPSDRTTALRIADIAVLSRRTRLLFVAEPKATYVLRYGAMPGFTAPVTDRVYVDTSAVNATLGPVQWIGGQGPDSDNDGIPDAIDNCATRANADQRDRDHDGIGDRCDNAPDQANTRQGDTDRDGIGDAVDNCLYDANPDQMDTDLNGVGWVCDDDDGDGVTNVRDNCVGLSNSDQRDLNNDGVGDACADDRDRDGVPRSVDNCSTDANPDQADRDRDGIGDRCDNCPNHVNRDQRDRDQNGIGDVCQSVAEANERDTDGDGIPDVRDWCREVPDTPLDTDGDGVGDACDNCPTLKNTDQFDGNQNGMGDLCEDSDGDGVLNPDDNCVPYANSDQRDRNENGIGDPCDDNDGDRFDNTRDNCPEVYNRDQADEDQDGVGNLCDRTDDRFTAQHPWLLWFSFGAMAAALVGVAAWILRRAPDQGGTGPGAAA